MQFHLDRVVSFSRGLRRDGRYLASYLWILMDRGIINRPGKFAITREYCYYNKAVLARKVDFEYQPELSCEASMYSPRTWGEIDYARISPWYDVIGAIMHNHL